MSYNVISLTTVQYVWLKMLGAKIGKITVTTNKANLELF